MISARRDDKGTSSEGNFPGPSNAFAQDTAYCHTQTKVPKIVLYLMCYELGHPSIGCLVAPENSILTESHKCHASTAYKIPFPTCFPLTTYNLKPTCPTTSQVHIRQSELELGTIHHHRHLSTVGS